MNFINLKNVSKSYGSKVVLKNITLDIYSGEILALLGINGAGKTTLSGLISTLHPLSSGFILFNDKSIYENLCEYRKIISICPQYSNLNSNLNVYQNIYYSGLLYGLSDEESKKRTDNLINRFNLKKYESSSIGILSGGCRQRVLIARSIIHDPKLLILDEPTTGLDPNIRIELWNIIKELKNNGTTIILTTHYIEEADNLADRICILKEGVLIEVESPNNLKIKYKNNNLENIFINLTGDKNE